MRAVWMAAVLGIGTVAALGQSYTHKAPGMVVGTAVGQKAWTYTAPPIPLVTMSSVHGDAVAQTNLGVLYDQGHGVPQDYAQAAVWWRKAAEQGDADAQYTLGLDYDLGQGVPQDYAEAYFWYDLAASGKLESSGVKQEDVAKDRDEAASRLTPADLSRVQERARKWFEAHAKQAEGRP